MNQGIQISSEKLFQIIGMKEVELALLREQVAQLAAENKKQSEVIDAQKKPVGAKKA